MAVASSRCTQIRQKTQARAASLARRPKQTVVECVKTQDGQENHRSHMASRVSQQQCRCVDSFVVVHFLFFAESCSFICAVFITAREGPSHTAGGVVINRGVCAD